MSSKEAIKLLESKGWERYRQGKGDHLMMKKGENMIVVPNGLAQLSPGMSGKVRSASRK